MKSGMQRRYVALLTAPTQAGAKAPSTAPTSSGAKLSSLSERGAATSGDTAENTTRQSGGLLAVFADKPYAISLGHPSRYVSCAT